MRSGERNWIIVYYVAFAFLIVSLAVAIGLFTRAVRQTSVRAVIIVDDAQPVDCPTGEGAPACFRFDVRNLGPEAAQVECGVQPADQPFAEFLTGGDAFRYSAELQPGLSFSLEVKVQPGLDGIVRAPVVTCAAS